MQDGHITVCEDVVLHVGQLAGSQIQSVAWQKIGSSDVVAFMLQHLVIVAVAVPQFGNAANPFNIR